MIQKKSKTIQNNSNQFQSLEAFFTENKYLKHSPPFSPS